MQAPQFLKCFAWDFAPEGNELIQSFNSQPLFLCQWLPDWVTWMIRSLELISRLRATPSPHQVAEMALKIKRHTSGKETSTWPASDLALFGNTGDLHQRWESNTTTTSCMTGTNHGRHGLRWQSWPNRSYSDWPRVGHPVLWVAIARRRTELGQGLRHCVHIVRCHQLGWQTSPTQCQASKPTPFNFCNQDLSPWPANFPAAAEWWEVPRFGPCPLYQEWGQAPLWGQDWGQRQWELWASPPWLPLLSSDHGFKSERSSASTSSSVASMSEGLGGSRCPHHGQWSCRELGGHMKINLPVFKDENTKEAVTYQSWCLDLTVYHCTGWQDCTLSPTLYIPYKVTQGSCWGAQGQTSPWMTSSPYWTNTTTMSRPWMLWTRTLSAMHGWQTDSIRLGGGVPTETPPDSHGNIPRMFSSRQHSWAEAWPFLQWTP